MKRLLLGTVLLLSLGLASPVHAADFNGKVLSIGDGDTIRVSNGSARVTVRLACIDAPETNQQNWGRQSANKLKGLLPVGQNVRIREIERDRYGRTVGEVFVGSKSINLEMVKTGEAVVYREYLNACQSTKNQYLSAEANAKANQLGFWAQSCPTMPWDFRRGKTASCGTPQRPDTTRGYIPGTCKQLKAMGLSRFPVGDPNYTASRDGDKDGIACE